MRRILILLTLLALPTLPVGAQTAPPAGGPTPTTIEFKDLLYGNAAPLTLKLKDLTSDWRHITVGGSSDAGGGIMSSLFGGGKGTVYYTKGQAVSVGGESYIVAYKSNLKQLDFMSLIMASAANGGKEPDMSQMMPEKLTPDAVLTLALINLRSSGSLTDIRPFDMAQEIADSASGGGGLSDLMMLGMMADKNKQAGTSSPTKPKKKP